MSNPPHFAPALVNAVQQLITGLAKSSPDVKRVVVTTSDGFEVASFQSNKTSSSKIAAISSSLEALAEAIAAEAGFSRVRDVIVQTDTGIVLVMAVFEAKPAMTLAVFAGSSAVLGHLLWAAKACCSAIAGAGEAQTGSE